MDNIGDRNPSKSEVIGHPEPTNVECYKKNNNMYAKSE